MRNHSRKCGFGHLRAAVAEVSVAALAAALALVATPLSTHASPKPGPGPCNVARGTLGEKDQPTPELSTEQLEAALASEENEATFLMDTRPYEEFAMSHIPGAITFFAGSIEDLMRSRPEPNSR